MPLLPNLTAARLALLGLPCLRGAGANASASTSASSRAITASSWCPSLTYRHVLVPLLNSPGGSGRRRSNEAPRARTFASSRPRHAKPLPPRPQIPEADIVENFLKGSGPGGQKINKTSSAVQLKHVPTGIVVKCQETRSRSQNRKIARRILGERIEEAELGEGSRTALKAAERSRRKKSAEKKRRRKYRGLETGREELDGGAGARESEKEMEVDGEGEGAEREADRVEGMNRDLRKTGGR